MEVKKKEIITHISILNKHRNREREREKGNISYNTLQTYFLESDNIM